MNSALALIIHPDAAATTTFGAAVRRLGLEVVHAATGQDALHEVDQLTPAVVILDLGLGDMPAREVLHHLRRRGPVPVIAVAEAASVRTAVEAMRAGAADVLDTAADVDEIEKALRAILAHDVGRPDRQPESEPQPLSRSPHGEVFLRSQKMREVGTIVARLASLSTPVLIRGESGVGKEVVALVVHQVSDRSDRPFVKIFCAAVPADVAQAELSRAQDELRGGTLFLDEVSAASAAAQTQILEILTDRQIRVLASTSTDMHGVVAGGLFRRDLYERLAVATIDVPPLRERRDEIDGLVHHFLDRFAREFQRPAPAVSDAMAELLRTYDWPGNVRELQDIMKRWLVLGGEDQVRGEIEARWAAIRRTDGLAIGSSLGLRDIARRAAREAERLTLQEALRRSKGNRAAVARQLKVSYKTLLQKLADAGLSSARRRNRSA
jgi:DNA-binding NtrC family response regulator